MDKDVLLAAIKGIESGTIDSSTLNAVVSEYMTDVGATKEQISLFMNLLRQQHFGIILYIQHCLEVAVEYLKEKYKVISLLDKEGRIIKLY